MAIDFLILSLPRSGSAWLSNFLTWGDCFCYHDPMAGGPIARLERQAQVTGAIDTGAWMFPAELPPVARMFALRREPRRIARSLRARDLPADLDFEAWRDMTSTLVTFDYERLFDLGYLRELWTLVAGPSAVFHVERARQLISMNVQRDLDELAGLAVRTYTGV
jgi:hypothetical protein